MNKFGQVCFVGRPNVGKSTLTNHFLKIPLAIESNKPQTTWYAVKGLLSHKRGKVLITDTPGIHKIMHRAQNQAMNHIAYSAISQADVICHLISATTWTKEDQHISDFLAHVNKPVFLVINQVDRFSSTKLLPFVAEMQGKSYQELFSISAKTGLNCDDLLGVILDSLPKQSTVVSKQPIHDHSEAFLAQEMIREQLMQQLQAEMPYTTHIEIFHTEQKEKCLDIHANLHVKHVGQKKIIIGHNGQQLKKIGELARKRLQVILKKRIMLKIWVKISTNIGYPDIAY